MSYIKELEQQNEELKQLLANAENYIYRKNNLSSFSYQIALHTPIQGWCSYEIARNTARYLISIKNKNDIIKYDIEFADIFNKHIAVPNDIDEVRIKIKKNEEGGNYFMINYKKDFPGFYVGRIFNIGAL